MRKVLIAGVAALAAITFAPIAHADGNAANLDQLVGQAYTQFQHGCTPSMTPQFQRIQWDSIDGTQGLGGPFKVYWNLGNGPFPGAQKIVPAQPQGYWDIVFEFC
jgi:hypothetical protein